jgi:hypothetical protein
MIGCPAIMPVSPANIPGHKFVTCRSPLIWLAMRTGLSPRFRIAQTLIELIAGC